VGLDAKSDHAGWLPAVSYCSALSTQLRVSYRHELAARQSPASKDMSMEDEQSTLLGAVTRQGMGRMQKALYMLQYNDLYRV
jgi:hypothetical protein